LCDVNCDLQTLTYQMFVRRKLRFAEVAGKSLDLRVNRSYVFG
jgi:hypothetical protein